ncbi:TIGR00730 family Rossman fold protein [Carboxylicivirga mesophila]|uniref:Cytokinin riboside 5'-monophosphate phosphoribohydrolase n=1 Tax=Carboxylicivirga mesophila TaxID=1166478 RepID=A0ABS5K445_9BACT|nr:TIGR00730 family Rossman fold protein [Carboxylicivirga mesophila]MBS2209795.1 TIGR00730 family Rossman fold protein [Carboxylicivirga mesophila]
MKNVTVFCASSPKVKQAYLAEATSLAEELVKANYRIVYGGGAVGLMGNLANRALELNGQVRGIIPHFMVEVEWEHKGVSDMVHVDDMAERKKLLVKDSDAIVVLAGGIGTLEELFEVLSLKKLGQITQPIILVNTGGFFDPLIKMLEKLVDEQFMRVEHHALWHLVESSQQVCQAIEELPAWHNNAIEIAAVK